MAVLPSISPLFPSPLRPSPAHPRSAQSRISHCRACRSAPQLFFPSRFASADSPDILPSRRGKRTESERISREVANVPRSAGKARVKTRAAPAFERARASIEVSISKSGYDLGGVRASYWLTGFHASPGKLHRRNWVTYIVSGGGRGGGGGAGRERHSTNIDRFISSDVCPRVFSTLSLGVRWSAHRLRLRPVRRRVGQSSTFRTFKAVQRRPGIAG